MKKAFVQTLMAAVAVASIVACKPNNDSSNNQSGDSGGTIAATPTVNCNIHGNTSCNPGHYQQFGTQFIEYYGTYTSGQFCGCPVNYQPIFTHQWGLRCAPVGIFQGIHYARFHYNQISLVAQNGHWTGIPQDIYSPAGNGANCYAHAAAVCDLRLNQTTTNGLSTNPHCGSSGGTCQPTGGGTSLGVCTNSVGNGYGGFGFGGGYWGGHGYGGNPDRCYQYVGNNSFVNVCMNAPSYGAGGGLLPR